MTREDERGVTRATVAGILPCTKNPAGFMRCSLIEATHRCNALPASHTKRDDCISSAHARRLRHPWRGRPCVFLGPARRGNPGGLRANTATDRASSYLRIDRRRRIVPEDARCAAARPGNLRGSIGILGEPGGRGRNGPRALSERDLDAGKNRLLRSPRIWVPLESSDQVALSSATFRSPGSARLTPHGATVDRPPRSARRGLDRGGRTGRQSAESKGPLRSDPRQP